MKQFELIFVDLHYIKHQKYVQCVLKKIQKCSNAPILQKLAFLFFARLCLCINCSQTDFEWYRGNAFFLVIKETKDSYEQAKTFSPFDCVHRIYILIFQVILPEIFLPEPVRVILLCLNFTLTHLNAPHLYLKFVSFYLKFTWKTKEAPPELLPEHTLTYLKNTLNFYLNF